MRTVTLPDVELPPLIIPYLPAEAFEDARSWMAQGKVVFQRVIRSTNNPTDCRNCAGVGLIYLTFCKAGPLRDPPSGLGTWYEGGPRAGKGWYAIEKTVSYTCPKCKGAPA